MCTIFFAPQMRTERYADAVCYEDVKFERTEQTEKRKRQLSMKWIVVTDEHGSRRLQMRWTVARSSVPRHHNASNLAMGRGSDPTPGRRHE